MIVKIADMARLAGMSYSRFYPFTFRADFPRKPILAADGYEWLVAAGLCTQADINAQIRADAVKDVERRAALREYNRKAQAKRRTK